jgi:1-acyl-sn-glycerol-3-phosphate acyltransferase
MLLFKRRILRTFISIFMGIITHIEVEGVEKLRGIKGKAIVVSNHLGRLDAGFAFYLVKRDDLIIVVAKKYSDYPVYKWFVRQLDLLWLDRLGADIGTIKEILRRLNKDGILLIAPEGTRSPTEALMEGKPGVAYLAAKSGAYVVPTAIVGSEDRIVKASFKRLRRPKIIIRVGEPFIIPPLPRKDRDIFLKTQTDEIMTQIGALLPDSHHGYYAQHPRLDELKESG